MGRGGHLSELGNEDDASDWTAGNVDEDTTADMDRAEINETPASAPTSSTTTASAVPDETYGQTQSERHVAELNAATSLIANSDRADTTPLAQRYTPLQIEQSGQEHGAWVASALAVLFIGAITFLIWHLRGLECRMDRLERCSSSQLRGRLDIHIKGDGDIAVTAPLSGPDAELSLHADPSADALPPSMTTNAVIFEDGSAWRTGQATRTGPRDDNQDAAKVVTLVRSSEGGYEFFDVAVIGDGLGGEPGGRRAAIIATEWAVSSVIAQLDSDLGPLKSIVERAMRASSPAMESFSRTKVASRRKTPRKR